MLRSRRIARVRSSRIYHAAAEWFAKAPFFILVLFNVMPIPLDVVRMLATTYQYPRIRFAGANFVGRFLRYGVIAFVTYWWNLGWIAVVSLLALAIAMGVARLLRPLAYRLSLLPRSRPGA
jgi:membrane protein YqaA with SNARE-associated domain